MHYGKLASIVSNPDSLATPRLAGFIISVSPEGFEAMESFYSKVLRLPIRSRRPGLINFEWPGDLRLTLHHHDRVVTQAKEPERFLINLAVDDLSAWHQRLLEAQVVVVRSPDRESWGGLVATYSDPEGNLVQLLALNRPDP